MITKIGLRRGLGLGATSALCYGVAAQHWVYILIGGEKQKTTKKKNVKQCRNNPDKQ